MIGRARDSRRRPPRAVPLGWCDAPGGEEGAGGNQRQSATAVRHQASPAYPTNSEGYVRMSLLAPGKCVNYPGISEGALYLYAHLNPNRHILSLEVLPNPLKPPLTPEP